MKPTDKQKLANRQRMDALGLKVERWPKEQRASYIRGNLQVHLALENKSKANEIN
ncbi:MAG TPA: hypothetical protein VFP95_06465 [Gammaproteobacteria bacterium]|nr:hypothetical protein [Gammaproteobacteria bacterium]